MKKFRGFCAILLCAVMLCAAAGADVTISDEEYALLQKYQKLESIKQIIEAAYLWEFDEDELYTGAAQGMLASLGDQYSYYYEAARYDEVEEEITGEYAGLGFEVFANAIDMTITIRRVFYGSPAQQGGIKANDKIIAVNGEEMTAYDLDKAVSIIRGEPGTEVTLTIYRDGESFDVTCKRAMVETETISYEMLRDNVGYIRIFYFEGSLDRQFADAVSILEDQGMQALVLDLRDNGGGFSHLAEAVCDVFLEEDDVIYSSEDKYGRKLSSYATGDGTDFPVAVLMNGYTASASEIVTMALLDHDVAFTVGETSFGKGIMQRVYTLDETTGMQLTSEYWLSPEDTCVHEVGITPDFEVALNEDALDENYNFIQEKDNQLQTAIDELLKVLAEQ